MMQDHFEHRSRTERRQHHRLERKVARRRTAIAVAVAIIIVCLGIGGWLGYRWVSAKHKPPEPRTYKVVIPEGLNIDQTAGKVADRCGISASEFKKAAHAGGYDYDFLAEAKGNLEGFLFPKTYQVTETTSARRLIRMMLNQYRKETGGLDWGQAKARGLSEYQVITVASLVEKEAKLASERPVVASVIYNRLKANMKLQLCATVQYALGKHKPVLSDKDLEVDSPYNTYRVMGLPPAPICNPGFESIRAALYPAATNYLYFLLTSPEQGRHSFTADYQEFLRLKQGQDK